MTRIAKGVLVLGLIVGLTGWGLSRAGHAAVVVMGGIGQSCWEAAREADHRHAVAPGAIDVCSRALDSQLSVRDQAATYVNRGVLYMINGQIQDAMEDFDHGAALAPNLAEAHVNLGASLVAMRHDRDGIAEITKGLDMGSMEPEKSYFNRAVAEEHLDDLQAAYRDYSKASELKPEWQQPKDELTRFQVQSAPAGR